MASAAPTTRFRLRDPSSGEPGGAHGLDGDAYAVAGGSADDEPPAALCVQLVAPVVDASALVGGGHRNELLLSLVERSVIDPESSSTIATPSWFGTTHSGAEPVAFALDRTRHPPSEL